VKSEDLVRRAKETGNEKVVAVVEKVARDRKTGMTCPRGEGEKKRWW